MTAVTAGCSVDPVQDRFVVTDSAGVAIASSLAPERRAPVVVDSTPRLVLPNGFGEPERFFFDVGHAVQLGDGTLVLGNRGSRELFFFSANGRFLGAVGGVGDGPGEFQRLSDIFRCSDDEIIVEENSRLSVIDGLSRSFTRTIPIIGHLSEVNVDIAGIRSDCSAVLMVEDHYLSPEPGMGLYRMAVTLYWGHLETGASDPIRTFDAIEAFPWMTQGYSVGIRPPYGRVAQWAAHREGVVVGTAEAAEYQIVGEGGALTRIVRWNPGVMDLTDQDWAYFERESATFRRQYPGSIPPEGHFPRPASRPAYSVILVDGGDRVWLQHYGRYGLSRETSETWSVFSSDGNWLAEVIVPNGLEVLAITESALIGVVSDELDVQTVHVYGFDLQP